MVGYIFGTNMDIKINSVDSSTVRFTIGSNEFGFHSKDDLYICPTLGVVLDSYNRTLTFNDGRVMDIPELKKVNGMIRESEGLSEFLDKFHDAIGETKPSKEEKPLLRKLELSGGKRFWPNMRQKK